MTNRSGPNTLPSGTQDVTVSPDAIGLVDANPLTHPVASYGSIRQHHIECH